MFSKVKFSNDFIISILVILFLVFLYFLFDLLVFERLNSNRIQEEGKQVTKELNINAEILLNEIEGIADEIADKISVGIINKDNIVNPCSAASSPACTGQVQSRPFFSQSRLRSAVVTGLRACRSEEVAVS